jgi:predicted nucleotidyltransferase
MSDDSPTIPLADVLRAANELVSAGLIEEYALGGALAAIYYVEPFTTYDADIFFVAKDKTLSAGIPAIYSHLQSKGWRVEHEHLLVNDFPVQFLAASGLTEEAVRDAKQIEYEGVPAKVFRPEYVIAIAASVGRHKDLARIDQMLEQAEIERTLLDDILARYNLNLPKP